MNLIQFIVLVLLGLFAPSVGAVPYQTIDVAAENTLRDLNRNVGKDLAARQGYPSNLLSGYTLKCALDREKTEFAPDAPGTFLTAGYCRTLFDCKSDGTKLSKPRPEDWNPLVYHSPLKTQNKNWCEKWCECVIVDEPRLHYANNFGCPNPAGEMIQGSFGSVARDTGSDGLVMEGYDGPPRKE